MASSSFKLSGVVSATAVLTVAVLVMVVMLPQVSAIRYIVGQPKGWASNVNFTVWAQGKHFYNGDWLFFVYDRHQLNVLEVNQTDYETCNSDHPIHNWTTGAGRDVVPLNKTKDYYFISGKGFCYGGVKLAIHVENPPPPPSSLPHMFPVYGNSDLVVRGYADASFQSDQDDSKSQSGFVFILNSGAVSWKSSKQATTADSTTDSEYIAASEAANEAVWIKKFITELGVVQSIEDQVLLYCDNTGAIAQSIEPRSHQKSKHVLRRYHLIREIVARGDIKIEKVPTEDNIADPLTKPLSQAKHEKHIFKHGLRRMGDWL